MSSDLHFSPAVAPDCAIRNARVHIVYGHQPWTWLELEFDGTLKAKHTLPIGYYPKTNGEVSVAHDGMDYWRWTRTGDDSSVGVVWKPTDADPWGNNPILVSDNGTLAYQSYPDVVVGDLAISNAARPTGLWEINDSGPVTTFATWDDCYYGPKPAGGAGLPYHTPDGRMVVCEGSSGVVGAFDGQPFALWHGLDTKWPRCAHDGEHVVIVAWGDPGPQARVWIGTVAELPAVPEIVVPPVPVGLTGRKLALGYFKAISDRYGDNPMAPGNCTVCETSWEAQRSPWRYYAPPGVGDGPRKIASFIEGNASHPFPAAEDTALRIWDGGSVLPPAPCGRLTGLECYSDSGESFSFVVDRMRCWLTKYPTARVILVGQAYDRNGTETDAQKLLDLQVLPLQLAVDFPQIEGVLYFSDGRPGGTREHPDWRAIHTEAATRIVSPYSMNHLDTVTEVRAKYGTPLGYENAWKTINETAYRHRDEGWKLLAKPSGTNWVVDGQGYSIDVIVNPTTQEAVDCLVNSETDGIPSWQMVTWQADLADRARDPIPPDEVEPDPPDTLEDRVAALEADVANIKSWIESFR